MRFVAGVLTALLVSPAAQADEVLRNVDDILVVRFLRKIRIPAADFCRQMPAEFVPTFVAAARTVIRGNAQRAKLKQAVNTVLGSSLVEEEPYAR